MEVRVSEGSIGGAFMTPTDGRGYLAGDWGSVTGGRWAMMVSVRGV